ncbi:L-lactate dehydrogenase complex protein LldG [Mucilaginibacter sp. UYP25]|uniref:LutC/YkgG family protein n=1 Tax=unclassified Mucilaginibacter TaxID=2617802 RepID=UPI0033993576
MTTREKILADVRKNQPPLVAAPDIAVWENKVQANAATILETFKTVAGNVGGKVISVKSIFEIKPFLDILPGTRALTTVPGLFDFADDAASFAGATPHELENVELAILQAEFGVAENSALWVTERQMGTRVLPFICQHLAFVVSAADIVPDMHAAYLRTQGTDHGFASFIAGPSKTADIEQSLVLGAHGPRSLMIFIVG